MALTSTRCTAHILIAVCLFTCYGQGDTQLLLVTEYLEHEIQQMDLEGNVLHSIDVGVHGYTDIYSAVYDYVERRYYFADGTRDVIVTMKADGSDIKEIAQNVLNSWQLVIDPVERFLYWTDQQGTNNLGKLSLEPGSIPQYLVTNEPQAVGIKLSQGYLYWGVSHVTRGKIVKMRPDGTDPLVLVTAPDVHFPNGIDIDISEQKLYWCDNSNSKKEVGRINTDGTGLEILRSFDGLGVALVLTPDLLIISSVGSRIFSFDRSDYAGSEQRSLSEAAPSGLFKLEGTGELQCVLRNPAVDVRGEVSIYGQIGRANSGTDVCFIKSAGAGRTLPTSYIEELDGDISGKRLAIPSLKLNPQQLFGVYSCVFGPAISEIKTVVSFQRRALKPRDDRVTKTASVGDEVVLSFTRRHGKACLPRIRWMKDGKVIRRWSGRTLAGIKEAALEDEGVYEIFQHGRRKRNQHGVTIVYIRDCPAGKYGVDCTADCDCVNGGHCDSTTGICSCPPGFIGVDCSLADSEKHASCSAMYGENHAQCEGLLFCLAGKFGCVCGSGYQGLDCMKECRPGRYGAGCLQRCPKGEHCNRFTGL